MPQPPRDDFESEGPGGTRLENVEEIRRQVLPRDAGTLREATPPPSAVNVAPFRPVHRPPTALLTVLFDGRDEGEEVVLRADRTVIGRSEGGVLIPHDAMMSSRHAEILRVLDKGRWRWFLTDLDSTNGTYVRVAHVLLKHQQEFLLGGARYRFDDAPRPAGTEPARDDSLHLLSDSTSNWKSGSPKDLPSFVELKVNVEGQRYFIDKEEHWIGSDPEQCSLVLADDPMINPRHAKIFRDGKGRWGLENAGSLNGVWLRIDRVAIEGTGHFQLGEQRFILKPL